MPLYKISSSPFLILFAVIIILSIFSKTSFYATLFKKKINIAYFVFFGLSLISLLYSFNETKGITELKNLLPLIIFPLLFQLVSFSKKQFYSILKAFLFGCFFAFIISISYQVYLMIIGANYSFHYLKLVEVLWMHPTYLSLYLNFAIVMSFYLFIKNELNLYLMMFSIAIFSVFIILLSARMQIIIFAFVFLLLSVYVLINNFSKRILAMFLLSFIALAITFSNYKTLNNRFTYIKNLKYDIHSEKSTSWNGANVRLAIWNTSKSLIKDNKFIGVGIGDADDELMNEYKKQGFKFAYKLKYVAHNQYIQTTISIGFVGLIAYLSILTILLSDSIRSKNFLVFSLFFILFFTGLTESFLRMQSGIVFFSFMIILVLNNSKYIKN